MSTHFGYALCLSGAALLLFGNSRPAQALLAPLLRPVWERYGLFLCLLLMGIGLLCFCWTQLRKKSALATTRDSSPPGRAWLLLALAAVCFYRLLLGLHDPFHFDEHKLGLLLKHADISDYLYPVLVPREPAPGQVIATLSSYLSGELFGHTLWSLRLPAYLFSFGTLTLLVISRTVPSALRLLAIAHLFVNQILAMYLHTATGYPAAIFFSTAYWIHTQHILNSPRPLSWKSLLIGTAIYLGLFTSHTFATGLFLAGIPALLVFTATHHLGTTPLANAKKLLRFKLWFTPLALFVVFRHLLLMKSYGNFTAARLKLDPILSCLGFNFEWGGRLLLLMGLALLIFALRKPRRTSQPFIFWLTFFAVGGLTLTLTTVPVSFVYPRFFLVFVTPLILSLGGIALTIRSSPIQNGTLGLLLFIFIALPAASMSNKYWIQHRQVSSFALFTHRAQQVLPANACLALSGNPHEVAWSREFYYSNHPIGPWNCQPEYFIHFGVNEYTAQRFPENPRRKRQLLFADHQFRTLSKKRPPPTILSAL